MTDEPTLDGLRQSVAQPVDTRVVVALSANDGGTTELLNSYEGIRVYACPATVDPRVTMGRGPLPVFNRWSDCEDYLLEHPGKRRPCLLSYVEAKRVFESPFADYTDYIEENNE